MYILVVGGWSSGVSCFYRCFVHRPELSAFYRFFCLAVKRQNTPRKKHGRSIGRASSPSMASRAGTRTTFAEGHTANVLSHHARSACIDETNVLVLVSSTYNVTFSPADSTRPRKNVGSLALNFGCVEQVIRAHKHRACRCNTDRWQAIHQILPPVVVSRHGHGQVLCEFSVVLTYRAMVLQKNMTGAGQVLCDISSLFNQTLCDEPQQNHYHHHHRRHRRHRRQKQRP